MKIQCEDLAQFIAVCAGLVREGVRFDADGATLTVDLTGGF